MAEKVIMVTSSFVDLVKILFSGAILSYIFCVCSRWVALRYHVHPKASFRRLERDPIPQLGGIGIFAAVAFLNLYFKDPILTKVLMASIPLVFAGTVDDIYELKPVYKILSQMASASLWLYLNGPLELFYGKVIGGPYFGGMISGLFLLTLTNAFNLLDGIDGQTGFVSFITFLAIAVIDPTLGHSSEIVAACVVGFLFINYPPAKIYLGEVGSSFLGFAAAALALRLPTVPSEWGSFWAMNFLFALPFCDIMHAMIRRLHRGQPPWWGDREHFHHKLLVLGFTKLEALYIAGAITLSSCAISWVFFQGPIGNMREAILFAGMMSLSMIYFGILWLESVWGRRFASSKLIQVEKFFEEFSSQITGDRYYSLVLDLQPYYDELQARGPSAMALILRDLASTLKSQVPFAKVKCLKNKVGIFIAERHVENELWQRRLIKELYAILLKHQAVRAYGHQPEGLKIFSPDEFLEARKTLAWNVRAAEAKTKRAS